MQPLLVILYTAALLLEVSGAGTIIWDLNVRRQRVIAARERSRKFEMSKMVLGADLVGRRPASDDLLDRVAALEQQADQNVQSLSVLPAKLQQEWSKGDDEVRNDSMQALDGEIERLEKFVGISDSIKRPLIGVMLVIVGTIVGSIGNVLGVLT